VQSVSPTRRLSAIVTLVAVVAVLAVAVVSLFQRPLVLVVAIACLGVAIGAAAYALTRTGARRLVAAVVAILALAAPLALVVAYGRLLQLLLLITLVAVAAAATRHALGRDLTSLKSGPTPGTSVGPAIRPVLLMNPRSGGGKVERFHLVQEARGRGIEPVVLGPGDDLRRLAEQAVAHGADVLGMAGGDGSQALVAGVAAAHSVAFVCVPAGTRNHLAMDLGLDRDDVVAALDAFGAAVERRIDLGLVDDQVFVNNATMGLYAKVVQSPAYREAKLGTAANELPNLLGPDAEPFDLRFTGPDGREHSTAHLILVSNGPYELDRFGGRGTRPTMDTRPGRHGLSRGLDGDVTPIVQTKPEYPARELSRGTQGWVRVQFSVTSIGTVRDAVVVDSEPDVVFDQAALKAIARWRYNPRVENGEAVERVGLQTIIRFTIEN